METLLVLIVLGAAVLYFFRGNARRGAETVRASIFLTGLETGSSVAEANTVASLDAENLPASAIRDAIERVRLRYGGKQLPMIAQAYRKGMKPKLAFWNQILIDIFYSTVPERIVAQAAPLTIDDVIDRGRLYRSLNKHMETLEVETDTPLGFRMSKFLSFGADIARQAADIPTSTDEMDPGPESAATVLVVQQGIHTLMTLEMGSDAVKTSSYKAEWAKVFEFTMWQTFRYDGRDPKDERGRQILELGRRVTKIAQSENAVLLQHIFDAWDSILSDLSDESIDQMGSAMREAVDWCQHRLRRP